METRAYRSKIGRLPWAYRNEINERIRDGVAPAALLASINASPAYAAIRDQFGGTDVSPQNLSDWRTTGYADWLADQDRTDRLRKLAETSQSMAAACGGDAATVGARLIAARLLDLLETADPDQVGDLVKAVAALRSGEAESVRLDIARRKTDLQADALALEQKKFRRQTAEMFLAWYEDQRAREIAGGDGDYAAKIDRLGKHMYGEDWSA